MFMKFLVAASLLMTLLTASATAVYIRPDIVKRLLPSEFSVSKSVPESVPEGEVSSTDLKNEWQSNAIAAEQRYQGKVWIISGRVTLVDRLPTTGVPYASMGGASSSSSDVICFFKESESQRSLPGVTVSGTSRPVIYKLQGTVRGRNTTDYNYPPIEVDNCSVIGELPPTPTPPSRFR